MIGGLGVVIPVVGFGRPVKMESKLSKGGMLKVGCVGVWRSESVVRSFWWVC